MSDLVQAGELVQQGIAAAKAGNKDQARQMLLQAVDMDEQNEQAWLWLSGLLDSPEERRICLENVLAINPGNTHAAAGLEWLERNAEPEPEPAPTIEQEQCPHCGAAIPPSGSVCPHCRRPLLVACPNCATYVDVEQSVCPECGRELGDFHEGALYYLELARAYMERGRNDLAGEVLGQAQASAGEDPEALGSVAALYQQVSLSEKAIAAYEQAIAVAPKDASLYASLGAVYRRRSQTEEARAMYAMAEQLDGDNPDILFELAQLSYEESGPLPDVIKMLHKVVQKQPMHAGAFMLLGDAYLAQERHRQARQQYTRAAQLTSSSSEIGQQVRRKLAELDPSPSYVIEAEPAHSQQTVSPELGKRPGCITVYALLVGAGAVLSLLGILSTAALLFGSRSGLEDVLKLGSGYSTLMTQQFTTYAAAGFAVALILAAINLAVAIGLWNMRNWARIIEIIRQGLGFVVTLFVAGGFLIVFRQSLTMDNLASYPMYALVALFVGFLIQAYFLFWFLANRERFQ